MRKPDLTRWTPPGFNVNAEAHFFIVGLAASFLLSLTFIPGYSSARKCLYITYQSTEKILMEGARMADFSEILGFTLYGFYILAICMLGMIIFHYIYHYKDSKSIYLMKRLPKSSELHKRCLALPITAFLICIISAFVMLLVYFGIYMTFTPEQCIAPDQWQKIWRDLP
ncbi:MAG: hypothetical protein IJC41_07225 [Firmicutes bacterium]|nr:hypothetical protein [Clostridiales bacterium]MBQ4340773.1 hypothetical protein [Bacillota bacterium]